LNPVVGIMQVAALVCKAKDPNKLNQKRWCRAVVFLKFLEFLSCLINLIKFCSAQIK
jgi:hypothetical protein